MASANETKVLVEKAQGGDRDAFEALVETHRDRLVKLVRSRLARGLEHAIDEDDVVQETFLRAFEGLSRFRWQGEDSFIKWVGVIASNLVHSAGRRKRARREESPEPEVAPVAGGCSPSRAMRRNERFDRLQRALDALDEDSRQVITLVRIEGLPVKEVARRIGRTLNATSILLHRAAVKLRELFGDTESLGLPARCLEDRNDGEQ